MKEVIALSKEIALEAGILYIEKFDENLPGKVQAILKGSEEAFSLFIKECLKRNKEAYVDFYQAQLSDEAMKKFLSLLSETQRQQAMCFEKVKGKYFFELNEDNYQFLATITAREIFFSTFYFVDKKATLWGNYNLTYPLFCESDVDLLEYTLLARACGLERV